MLSAEPMERRLQISGILLFLGIVVEMLCVVWTRPIAFVVFVTVGGLFLALGVLVFLLALISRRHSEP
jgi:hypothetical protein